MKDLTPLQNQVLCLLAAGYSTEEVVSQTGVSKRPTQNKLDKISCRKLEPKIKMNDEIIQELTVVGFSTITDYISLGAIPRLRSDIPKEKLAAVKELTCTNKGLIVKLHDKASALNRLGDYYGLWSDFNNAIATLKKYGLELYRDDAGKWYVEDLSNTQTANIEE